MPKSVVLRNEHSQEGTRFLGARVAENGDLTIEGWDFGAGVEGFWGAGLREYEWAIVVRAAHVPQLSAALAGTAGDDVMALLAVRGSDDPRCATREFLEERAIPFEFWNRIGE